MNVRLFAVALLLLSPAVWGDDDPVGEFALEDTEGKRYAFCEQKDARAVVFVFMGVECPLANRYVPRLQKLHKMFEPSGIRFFAVNSNSLESVDVIRKHAKDMELPFPVLLDREQRVADLLKVGITPTAIVVDMKRLVRYRGRIDDHKSEDLVKTHYVRDVLDALVAGKPVTTASTEAVGCQIQRTLVTRDCDVTYASRVAKILNERCVSCHRPGQVAPFSLMKYDDAKRWARDIKRHTQWGTMPPWKPAGHDLYRDERRLTSEEKEALAAWSDAGAPLGEANKVPKSPAFPEGWMLGDPDLVLEAPEYEVSAEGSDEYRCYVLPTNLPEDKWISAIELRPGNFRVVHHILAYVDTSGMAEKLDARDPKPGYRTNGTGPGFVPSGEMGGWAPGNFPYVLPDGIGRLLKKQGRIVLETHYHKTGRKEKDHTKLGLHFAKKPVTRELHWLDMVNPWFIIPAGKERHRVTAHRTLRGTIVARSITPHMHLLGREVKIGAQFPDKSTKTLIHIADWDFNWQDTYHFKEPITLPKGTRLLMEVFYDNSEKNPNNPRRPPRAVRWGEETTDEMCLAFMSYTLEREEQGDED